MDKIDNNTYQANDWIELQRCLFEAYDASLERYRSQYAYRGVSNKDYGLQTSIQRIGRIPSSVESHLIRNFQKYTPINTLINPYDNIWNWITLGQHHGLPTRLLDWTFSPNVALHFMTDDIKTFGVDGAIWMVDFIKMKELFPANLRNKIDEKKILSFSSNELNEIVGKTVEEISEFTSKYGNCLIFFEPPSIDDRIVNQFAMFSFMLNPDTDKLLWLKENPDIYKKIIIPSKLKWEIRDKLDQANITERIIYPGLDGISKWLARWYTEKENSKKWKI